MWPPPAPPEYMDRTQLPANLRPPSSLVPRRHDADEVDEERPSGVERESEEERPCDMAKPSDLARPSGVVRHSDVARASDLARESGVTRPSDVRSSNADGSQLMRSPSSGSDVCPVSADRPGTVSSGKSGTDHTASSDQRGSVIDRSTDDRRVRPAVTQDSQGHVHLKRSSADYDEEVQAAKRPSDDVSGRPTDTDHTMMDDLSRSDDSSKTEQETTPARTESRDEPEREFEVPPRLQEKGISDEPMVIEFSAGSGGDDGASTRAGHKRARVNSDSVHNDVIKHSFVKRPVTFYGNLAHSAFYTHSAAVHL